MAKHGSKSNYAKNKDEVKQISSTGARALLVLVSLFVGPKSFEEIKEFLVDCGFTSQQYSIDTARMDLNALKAIGCEIGKALKTNNYKYSLISHPFKVKILPAEVFFIREAYKHICKTCSPETLLEYHKLFNKLADIASSEEIREELLGISLLKGMDLSIIKDLVADEKHHNKIQIVYLTTRNNEVIYDITLERLGLRSNKLYAFGYNHTLGKRTFLRVSKIRKILCKFFDKSSEFGLDTHVKFKLTRSYLYPLEPNESVLETNLDTLIVAGRYYNDFIAIQRVLSFGEDCVVIEPIEIRERIIEKLLEMKELYGSR